MENNKPCPYCGKSDSSHDSAYPHPRRTKPEAAQTAGASNLPDGYVLMPKSPNEAILQLDGWPRMEWARYQAMIAEAQAQTAALASSANARFDGSISKLGAPEAFVPSSANALSEGDRVDVEMTFLEEWLTLAATPVGLECCGQSSGECCGNGIAVDRGAEEVISVMAARHRELIAILQSQKGGGHG